MTRIIILETLESAHVSIQNYQPTFIHTYIHTATENGKRLYILLLTRYFADNAEREIGPCVWQAGHYDSRVAYIDDR